MSNLPRCASKKRLLRLDVDFFCEFPRDVRKWQINTAGLFLVLVDPRQFSFYRIGVENLEMRWGDIGIGNFEVKRQGNEHHHNR